MRSGGLFFFQSIESINLAMKALLLGGIHNSEVILVVEDEI